jgi:hypothetical protein
VHSECTTLSTALYSEWVRLRCCLVRGWSHPGLPSSATTFVDGSCSHSAGTLNGAMSCLAWSQKDIEDAVTAGSGVGSHSAVVARRRGRYLAVVAIHPGTYSAGGLGLMCLACCVSDYCLGQWARSYSAARGGRRSCLACGVAGRSHSAFYRQQGKGRTQEWSYLDRHRARGEILYAKFPFHV